MLFLLYELFEIIKDMFNLFLFKCINDFNFLIVLYEIGFLKWNFILSFLFEFLLYFWLKRISLVFCNLLLIFMLLVL